MVNDRSDGLFDGPDDFLGGDDDFLGDDPLADDATAASVPEDVARLQEGLRSTDLATVIATLGAIAEQGVGPLQDQVASLLQTANVPLGKEGIDAILDCLEAIGDGRCVRVMERVLYERGDDLSEHQAWRARHIVQKIRRFGRK